MKKIVFVCFSLTILFFYSCSQCSSKHNDTEDKVPIFVAADTAEVISLAEEYLTYVSNQQHDEAINMLSVVENGELMPLDDDVRQKIEQQQKTFPVLRYHLIEMDFVDEANVTLTYSIEFFEKDPNNPIPNTVNLSFSLYRINAEWYLTMNQRTTGKL